MRWKAGWDGSSLRRSNASRSASHSSTFFPFVAPPFFVRHLRAELCSSFLLAVFNPSPIYLNFSFTMRFSLALAVVTLAPVLSIYAAHIPVQVREDSAVATATSAAASAFQAATSAAPSVASEATSAAASAFQAATSAFPSVASEATSVLASVAKGATSILPSVASDITSAVGGAINTLTSDLPGAAGDATSVLGDAGNAAASEAAKAKGLIGAGVRIHTSAAVSLFVGVGIAIVML
ncbi:hypothetical protein C8R44DRAFT_806007 [Mycena epipterygia]|nr:hypothetical protein C8R44DRAFT_806007 [Mycena epipterygia]